MHPHLPPKFGVCVCYSLKNTVSYVIKTATHTPVSPQSFQSMLPCPSSSWGRTAHKNCPRLWAVNPLSAQIQMPSEPEVWCSTCGFYWDFFSFVFFSEFSIPMDSRTEFKGKISICLVVSPLLNFTLSSAALPHSPTAIAHQWPTVWNQGNTQ